MRFPKQRAVEPVAAQPPLADDHRPIHGPVGLGRKTADRTLAAREGDRRRDLRGGCHPSRKRLNAGQTPVLPRHRPGPGRLARSRRRAFGRRPQRSRIEQRRPGRSHRFAELAAGQVRMGNRVRRQSHPEWHGRPWVSSSIRSRRTSPGPVTKFSAGHCRRRHKDLNSTQKIVTTSIR